MTLFNTFAKEKLMPDLLTNLIRWFKLFVQNLIKQDKIICVKRYNIHLIQYPFVEKIIYFIFWKFLEYPNIKLLIKNNKQIIK